MEYNREVGGVWAVNIAHFLLVVHVWILRWIGQMKKKNGDR